MAKELTPTQRGIMQDIRDGARLCRVYRHGRPVPRLDGGPVEAVAVAALVRHGYLRDPISGGEYAPTDAGAAYLDSLEPTPPPVYGRPRPA